MNDIKVGSSEMGNIYLGTNQLSKSGSTVDVNKDGFRYNYSMYCFINTNNHPVNFILDDVLEETVDANSVWFINTSRNHFLNMVTTENVYIHIFSDTVILPMTYMIAGNPIPVDLDSDDGVMIIISAQ